MKNNLLILLIQLGCTFSLFSQATYEYKNAIKINPMDFAKSEFQLSYEHYFNQRSMSLVLMPSIILKENNNDSSKGWQAMAQYRFYLSHYNKNVQNNFLNVFNYGFYAGVYGLYLDYDEEYVQSVYDPITFEYENQIFQKEISSVEGGAMLGLQIDITKRIVLDFYLGGGIRKSEVDDTYNRMEEYIFNYSVFDRAFTGVKPKSGLLLGITF